VGIVGLALAGSSLVVDLAFTRSVWRHVDEHLAEDARQMALMVEEYLEAPWELEPGAFEALRQSRGPASVELWLDDGTVLGRAPFSTEVLAPPVKGVPSAYRDVTLADGRPGRLLQTWLRPRPGEGLDPTTMSGRKVGITVVRDVDDARATIASFRLLLWGPTGIVIVLAALAVAVSIRRTLTPVARLSDRIAALDASSLDDRLDVHRLPAELRTPFVKVNELLERLQRSFARERQFNADVSHELRTPLAGLRAILEVAASRDRPAAHYRAALAEALGVVRQMDAIVENLLMLARLGAGQATVRAEDFHLRELVDRCFAPLASAAHAKELRFENRVAPDATVCSDEDKLCLVVSNILSNAVEYTERGGWIAVECGPGADAVVTVRDSGPPIPSDALDRLFDPFYRADGARSGGVHFGVGLTLVRGMCGALGYRVAAANEPSGAVAFTVSR
jgi:signal transduction histidine kinase